MNEMRTLLANFIKMENGNSVGHNLSFGEQEENIAMLKKIPLGCINNNSYQSNNGNNGAAHKNGSKKAVD